MTTDISKTQDRVIPFTEPGPLWSQREYVACTELGIGFAAHRFGKVGQVFHYHFPADADCCTSIVTRTNGIERYIDHPFEPGLGWLEQCSRAMQ